MKLRTYLNFGKKKEPKTLQNIVYFQNKMTEYKEEGGSTVGGSMCNLFNIKLTEIFKVKFCANSEKFIHIVTNFPNKSISLNPTYPHIHTHIKTHTFTHTHIHIHNHKHTLILTYTQTTHIYTHTYTYAYIHTYVHKQTHTQTLIYIYIHTHTHIHTHHTHHTHTPTQYARTHTHISNTISVCEGIYLAFHIQFSCCPLKLLSVAAVNFHTNNNRCIVTATLHAVPFRV
jgi:hypothetical protein